MLSNCAGICIVDDYRFEYQIIVLEYIVGQKIDIEAVCLHPFSKLEIAFKLSTSNLVFADQEKLEMAYSIINSVIKDMKLVGLRKLIIRNKEVFYVCG